MFQAMKLHLLIFVFGLAAAAWLYYVFNIQYKPATPFFNGPLTSLPKTLTLDLDQLADDSLTFKDSILISGQTSPQKEVLIFTDSQDMVIKSKNDGYFSQVLDLDTGVNRITVVVFDDKGNSKSQERTVYYSEEKL